MQIRKSRKKQAKDLEVMRNIETGHLGTQNRTSNILIKDVICYGISPVKRRLFYGRTIKKENIPRMD